MFRLVPEEERASAGVPHRAQDFCNRLSSRSPLVPFDFVIRRLIWQISNHQTLVVAAYVISIAKSQIFIQRLSGKDMCECDGDVLPPFAFE